MPSNPSVVRVKICGITREDDARVAVEAGAHALGFVFFPPSPRYVSPEHAASIISILPPFVTAVGLFVNCPRDDVERACERAGVHVIQLQGDETAQDCLGYRLPVIKAFRLGPEDCMPDFASYKASGVLMDASVPGMWGGTGKTLDWPRLASQLESVCPQSRDHLILAGGLTAQNVGEAIRTIRPYAVDTSSGVETSPGKKSHTLIKEFIHAVHQACTA